MLSVGIDVLTNHTSPLCRRLPDTGPPSHPGLPASVCGTPRGQDWQGFW